MDRFSGYPLTRWEGNRIMILEEDFFYVDRKGKKWLVPGKKGEINGATIPRRLWGIIGSPYVGRYRRASVVHDYFVGEGNNPDVSYRMRRSADKMFFGGCRTDGCSWGFAAILYIGVSIGSWSSRKGLEHSKINEEMKSTSLKEDEMIEIKYLELRAKAEGIISKDENFDALEALVEAEIEK